MRWPEMREVVRRCAAVVQRADPPLPSGHCLFQGTKLSACLLGPLRDPIALLLGDSRVNVQHKRIYVGAEFRDEEGCPLVPAKTTFGAIFSFGYRSN